LAKLPQSYLQLRKSAKDVWRPFIAQAVVLLQQARTLADWFSVDDHNTAENLKPLEA
jgi:hypothetical protein